MQPESWESRYLKKVYQKSDPKPIPAPVIPETPKPITRKSLPKKHGFKALLVFSVIFMMLLAAMFGFGAAIFSRFMLFETLLTLMPGEKLLTSTNFLVMGLDEGVNIHRSDAMMVLHLDPTKNSADIIAIPRDTRVIIPGRGEDKINHAYAYGGGDLARRTAENLLNIKIPYYVSIDIPGLGKMIDDIGGVTIDVEKRMYYVDHSQNLFVDLYPGVQKLDGNKALSYLRFRHDDGDLQRIGRQQKFIKAITAQILSRENILHSPQLIMKLFSFMDTNLNSKEILGLALSMRKIFEMGEIKMIQIPGSSETINGVYYMMPDTEAVAKIVEGLGKNN